MSKFDLTCDNDWLQPIPSIAFMVGMLFGALIIGTLADMYANVIVNNRIPLVLIIKKLKILALDVVGLL